MTQSAKHNPRSIINRVVFGAASVLVLLTFPGTTFVANVASAASCTPVTPASNGVTKPTGSAAHTFTYSACTGLWTNARYTYSPATQQYTPNPGSEPVYSCDTSTYTWKVTQWIYIASHNDYEQQTSNASSVPGGNGTCVAPAPVPASSPASTLANQPAVNNSPSAGSNISDTNSNNTNVNDNNNVTLTNNIDSDATSGDVNLNQNTSAGNAASGNALANATIINSVNTSSSLNGGNVVTFTKDINGDVNGDIIINPNQLQPSSINLDNSNNLTLNSQTNGTINNNVNLNAQSGDVTAKQNTKVGDATSGSASAVADVVNMLNSYVSANQSFIGTININGSLHGSILMPREFLNSLIASGAPHNNVSINTSNTANLTDNSVTNIKNQINSQATSGAVDSSQNTKAGDATSGSANTNVEVYNLTGHQIVGTNSLLVFVNVTGKWVGVIVDAPSGSNSAALGGNITSNTTNTTNVNASTNNTINNNINVDAASGNVNSTQNTVAGNATSGNATTSVSLANISNDSLSLSGWFGVLFINVFGSWYGNFGVAPTVAAPSDSSNARGSHGSTSQHPVFGFVPKSAAATSTFSGTTGASGAPQVQLASTNVAKKVLADSTVNPASAIHKITADPASSSTEWYAICGALVLAGLLMFLSSRKSSRQANNR